MELLATGTQRASKSSQVIVGGTALAFSSWQANVSGNMITTNNFESYDQASGEAYDEGILGFLKCDGQYGGDWDASLNPVDFTAAAPPALYPRDDLADVQFVVAIQDGTEWDFPYQRVNSSNCGSSIDNEVTFTVGYTSQGVFNFPTGSV